MPYTATEAQAKMFAEDHEFLKENLKLGKEILWLTKEECAEFGPTTEETLEYTKQALIAHGTKTFEMPAKIGIHPWEDVFFHAMPAYVPDAKACGIKWIECFPRNPKQFDLPQTTGLLILNDIETGVPYAVMDCAWLTGKRTPAVTALSAEKFAPNAEYFGMFGCGLQGQEHVRFVSRTLKNLKKIYVNDVRPEMEDYLIKTIQSDCDVEIVKGTPQQMAETCEVLGSATIILQENLGVVKREWVGAGQTILPCDLNTFFESSILYEADKYFVDSIDEHELFASMGYFPDGLPKVVAQTTEVLAGLADGRTSKDELIVVSNIGISVTDVVMGRAIFEKAIKLGKGTKLPL